MSQANVEVVRRFVLDERGEWLTYLDSGVVWNQAGAEGPARGVEGVNASMTRWESTWDDYDVIPEEFVDAGERVLAILRVRGRGRESGLAIDARFHQVFTLHDGKIARMDEFTDRSEALEAAGLSE